MNKYLLKVVKTQEKQKSYQLFEDKKLIAEGKDTTENLFKNIIDKYNPQIVFVKNLAIEANE